MLVRALLLGIPAGLLLALVRLRPYSQWRDVGLPVARDGVELGIAAAAVAVLAWLVLFRGSKRWLAGPAGARVAVLGVFSMPAILVVREVNRHYLPGLAEPRSLIANAILLSALAFGGLLLARSLLRWQEGSWRTARTPIAALGLLALIPLGARAWSAGRPRDPGPDVLVLLVDVLRADHLGCYGYERPTSPNIDRLAADSVLFEDLSSASTFTKTSIASLFTGLPAHRHGVYMGSVDTGAEVESDVLSPELTTLAEALYDHGLNTVAWVENRQLRAYMGFDQGFSLYHDQPGSIEVIVDGFLEWLGRWGDEARYFAYLHFLDLPRAVSPPVALPRDVRKRIQARDGRARPHVVGRLQAERSRREIVLSQEALDELEAKYDELILYIDDLDRPHRGRLEGERPLRRHGSSC